MKHILSRTYYPLYLFLFIGTTLDNLSISQAQEAQREWIIIGNNTNKSDTSDVQKFEEEEPEVLPEDTPAPSPTLNSFTSGSSPSSSQLTRLRVYGKPLGVWRHSSSVTLEEVKVTIWNAGLYPAEGVLIKALIPGGKEVPLAGPPMLNPNKRAEYTSPVGETIRVKGDIQVKASCTNCRKGN